MLGSADGTALASAEGTVLASADGDALGAGLALTEASAAYALVVFGCILSVKWQVEVCLSTTVSVLLFEILSESSPTVSICGREQDTTPVEFAEA